MNEETAYKAWSPSFSGLIHFVLVMIAIWFLARQGPSFSEHIANFVDKCHLILLGIFQMIFSQDRNWKKQGDPEPVLSTDNSISKTIIFLRHGESEWNEVFNRGFGLSFFYRFLKALWREILYLGTRDSIFFDSPLSETGIAQAKALKDFLAEPAIDGVDDEGKQFLVSQGSTEETKSLLVTSNLRRAIATGSIALEKRLQDSGEKVMLLSCLQEVSRNVDTIALAHPYSIPDMHGLSKLMWPGFSLANVYNPIENHGTKSVLHSNGLLRMKEFNDFVFGRPENTIIVSAGHSLWFREYFRAFLPYSADHDCKKKKMTNCGVLRFTLRCAYSKHKPAYCIEPDSVKVIYGGFAQR